MSERRKPPEEPRQEETIKVMPDQETLEAFMEGMSGPVKVYFDTELGEFVWLNERPSK